MDEDSKKILPPAGIIVGSLLFLVGLGFGVIAVSASCGSAFAPNGQGNFIDEYNCNTHLSANRTWAFVLLALGLVMVVVSVVSILMIKSDERAAAALKVKRTLSVPPATSPEPVSAQTLTSQFTDLAALHEKGALTAEQYEHAKNKLLE